MASAQGTGAWPCQVLMALLPRTSGYLGAALSKAEGTIWVSLVTEDLLAHGPQWLLQTPCLPMFL